MGLLFGLLLAAGLGGCGLSIPVKRRTAFSLCTSLWAKEPLCVRSLTPSTRTTGAPAFPGWLYAPHRVQNSSLS